MKKLTSFLLGAFVIINAFAQEPQFSWGQMKSKTGPFTQTQIIGYEKDGFFIVNKREPDMTESQSIIRSAFSPVVTAEFFNAEGDRNFSKDISTGRSDDYVDVIYFDHTLYMISALFTKATGKNVLTAKAINDDGSMEEPVEIGVLPSEKMGTRGLFYVAVSPDGSKLLVLSQPEYVKDQNEKIKLTLLEKNFKKVWETEQTFSYGWSRTMDNRPYVNNNGTAYILKMISVKGADDSWSIFSSTGKDLKEFKIAMDGGKKIASVVQAFSSEGDFTIAGYYKNGGGKVRLTFGDKVDGSFLYRVDAAGQQSKIAAVNPFAKRDDMLARNIVFHENTTMLLGEKYVVTDRAAARSSSAPQTNETMFARDYSCNGMDIIVDGFDASGKPMYNTSIDKNNNSKNDQGYWVSYFAAIVKGKLQIVFMDNLSRYDGKKISINTPNIIVYTSMDPTTGKAEKPQPVLKPGPVGGKEGDSYLRPDAFLKMDENKFIIRAENGTGYRMGMMAF
ncbi:MAG: hypothetical protein ABIN36_09140 [Ferruginibacter sp.]